MIGLPHGVVQVVPYTAEWQRLFHEEQIRLQASIGDYVLDVQHIGSTSIPGMVAKPIIDIGVAVSNFEEAAICIEPVAQLGYEYRGEYGIPRRHYFVQGHPRTHHVHMLELTSEEWKKHLHFRDYLIQHPDAAREYAGLKLKLVQQFATDREAYQDGKDAFIKRILGMIQSGEDAD